MRLLNVHTKQMQEFTSWANTPRYAILSHVWSDSEISYQDFVAGRNHDSYGYKKVEEMCRIVREGFEWEDGSGWPDFTNQAGPSNAIPSMSHGLLGQSGDSEVWHRPGRQSCNWVWVDTCCIDKSSSAELSEAINSMFEWYQDSLVCLIFLPDVASLDGNRDRDCRQPCASFADSKWFKRGWTLQELIAPSKRLFYDTSFSLIGRAHHDASSRGSRKSDTECIPSLNEAISKITKIDLDVLTGEVGPTFHCVARRLAWASSREVTKAEDEAYSLLGLCGINMPLLYGEGGRQAFRRLQLEIVSRQPKRSIFSWGQRPIRTEMGWNFRGLLAERVSDFRGCYGATQPFLRPGSTAGRLTTPIVSTSRGLELEVTLPRQLRFGRDQGIFRHHLIPLNCCLEGPAGLFTKRPPDQKYCFLIVQSTTDNEWGDHARCAFLLEVRLAHFEGSTSASQGADLWRSFYRQKALSSL